MFRIFTKKQHEHLCNSKWNLWLLHFMSHMIITKSGCGQFLFLARHDYVKPNTEHVMNSSKPPVRFLFLLSSSSSISWFSSSSSTSALCFPLSAPALPLPFPQGSSSSNIFLFHFRSRFSCPFLLIAFCAAEFVTEYGMFKQHYICSTQHVLVYTTVCTKILENQAATDNGSMQC